MNYLWAFCVGGAICLAGQLLIRPHQPDPGPYPDRVCGGRGGVVGGRLVRTAGAVGRLRGNGAAAGVWASAGQGGAHSTGAAGSYGDLDRGAYRSLGRDHRLSGVRGGVLLAGQQP